MAHPIDGGQLSSKRRSSEPPTGRVGLLGALVISWDDVVGPRVLCNIPARPGKAVSGELASQIAKQLICSEVHLPVEKDSFRSKLLGYPAKEISAWATFFYGDLPSSSSGLYCISLIFTDPASQVASVVLPAMQAIVHTEAALYRVLACRAETTANQALERFLGTFGGHVDSLTAPPRDNFTYRHTNLFLSELSALPPPELEFLSIALAIFLKFSCHAVIVGQNTAAVNQMVGALLHFLPANMLSWCRFATDVTTTIIPGFIIQGLVATDLVVPNEWFLRGERPFCVIDVHQRKVFAPSWGPTEHRAKREHFLNQRILRLWLEKRAVDWDLSQVSMRAVHSYPQSLISNFLQQLLLLKTSCRLDHLQQFQTILQLKVSLLYKFLEDDCENGRLASKMTVANLRAVLGLERSNDVMLVLGYADLTIPGIAALCS